MSKRLRILLTFLLAVPFPTPAQAAGAVRLSEIAWAGSTDSFSDEWIELENTSGAAVDLAGWTIVGATKTYLLSGSVPASGFFLIERREISTSVPSNLLVSAMSLPNGGERLQLKDAAGAVVDEANPAGGAWPAGSATTYATMAFNGATWANGAAGASTASLGATILGTPGTANGAPSTRLALTGASSAAAGSAVTVTLETSAAPAILSYGATVEYDPAVLAFETATDGGFLATDGTASGFQAGLENGDEGILVLGGAQTATGAAGVTGSGALAHLVFTVLPDAPPGTTTITLTPSSFLANGTADIPASRIPHALAVTASTGVTNLVVEEGAARYSLALRWDAMAGAERYVIDRDGPDGPVRIGTSTTPAFLDDDAGDGGDLVPTRTYTYTVRAVRGGVEGPAATASGVERRGLLGDSTRDDRTDGRDLTLLARHWGAQSGEGPYLAVADTTVDGAIDGADLLDLAANWARTYP